MDITPEIRAAAADRSFTIRLCLGLTGLTAGLILGAPSLPPWGKQIFLLGVASGAGVGIAYERSPKTKTIRANAAVLDREELTIASATHANRLELRTMQARMDADYATYKSMEAAPQPLQAAMGWASQATPSSIDAMWRAEPPTIDIPAITSPASGFATTEALPRADIDTTWLTPQFARSSKMIAAERGAGKSFYLRWEVATLMAHEADPIVLFIDPHLRVSQMAAGHQAVWLGGSAEEERAMIIHEPRQAKQELEKVYSAVRKRIRGEEGVERLIKVIIDEADADFWQEEGAGDSLNKLLKIVANEARKANVEITLVAHSLKKNTTGFDAAHLSQISWLMLGGILGSPDIKWPNDLDPKRWAEERELMQVSLDDSVGRACVLRERGDGRSSIRIVVMPPSPSAGGMTTPQRPSQNLAAFEKQIILIDRLRQQIRSPELLGEGALTALALEWGEGSAEEVRSALPHLKALLSLSQSEYESRVKNLRAKLCP